MLMGISNADQMAQTLAGLKAALQHGILTQPQIDEAVIRILALKLQYHLLPEIAA
jgi:beta-N-acetylhexosaminidase